MTHAAHTISDLINATDSLDRRDTAAFGIEHAAPMFTGTVRGYLEPLVNDDAASLIAVEAASAWLREIWCRADTVLTLMGNQPLGLRAQEIRAMAAHLRECVNDLAEAIRRGDGAQARDAHAILTTGLHLDGSEL